MRDWELEFYGIENKRHSGMGIFRKTIITTLLLAELAIPKFINRDLNIINKADVAKPAVTSSFTKEYNFISSYKFRYDSMTVSKIDKFKSILLEAKPEYSVYITELFSQPSIAIEPGVDSLINDLYEKKPKRTYEEAIRFYGYDTLKLEGPKFF